MKNNKKKKASKITYKTHHKAHQTAQKNLRESEEGITQYQSRRLPGSKQENR